MIITLNNTCDQMRKHIALAKSDSTPMLEEASTLVASKQETETKQAVLTAFTKHFIVADEELDLLTSSAMPVNEQFFVVLSRVKQIHDDCEALLGSENERLGMEMMEQTARNLDAGFKKLYNWVQRALKGLDFEEPQISGSIRRALRVLSERPSMFQKCLEFLADSREQTLSDAFQRALSGTGDASGNAIDFSAHDLLRYMGDMLAWVHSTTVSEKESLEGLFIADADAINRGMKLGKVSEPWLQEFGMGGISNADTELSEAAHPDSFDGEKALKDLVSRSLSTITVTVRERIELAIHQHDDVFLLFKAQNLLTFYHNLFAKLLDPTSALTTTIRTLETATQSHLYQALDSDASTSWPSDPTTGPLQHNTYLTTLSTLFTITPPTSMPPTQFSRFLAHYIGPTLEFAQQVSHAETEPDQGDAPDVHLMIAISYVTTNINFLSKYTIAGDEYTKIVAPFTDHHLQKTLENAMVQRVYTSMMSSSGLTALTSSSSDEEGEELNVSILPKLPEYADQLDAFLRDGYTEIAGRLREYENREEGRKIVEEAKERFLEELQGVFVKLEALGEEYREVYPRTMEDVEVLLG